MSGYAPNPDGNPPPAPANWQALAGHQPPPQEQQPLQQSPNPYPLPTVHGGWQQAWQDEHGQWHAPWAAHQPPVALPYAGAAQVVADPQPPHVLLPPPSVLTPPAEHYVAPAQVVLPALDQPQFVHPSELAPVGPPRYLAPARPVSDPRRNTLAAVLVFVSLLIGLWGLLGAMGSMSDTLSSIVSGNGKLKLQLEAANGKLLTLDSKVGHTHAMAEASGRLETSLGGIDKDMTAMLRDVERVGVSMGQVDASIGTLDTEVGKVNELDKGMAQQLQLIATGLQSQATNVKKLRTNVEATDGVLRTLPGRLGATNDRLGYVNQAVNQMGVCGIKSELKVSISAGPIPTGTATVYATVIPASAWGSNEGSIRC